VIALLGDSTFFHSGLPALMNAVKNKNDLIVFIMDNQSTSMTGHQDHPGTGKHIDKTPASRISFEKLIEGIGVPKENIWTTSANNLKDLEASIEKALETQGVRVIIPRTLCALLKIEQSKKEKKPLVKFEVDQNACTGDEICLRTLGCPALKQHGKKVIIDENLCTGCSVCAQICVKHAIKAKAPPKKP
jgi:indolepyruvate ferredoxin oxidoreductase alpha subunit